MKRLLSITEYAFLWASVLITVRLFMASSINIYQTANELIKQHGDDAPIHAAMRADELLDAGLKTQYEPFGNVGLSAGL